MARLIERIEAINFLGNLFRKSYVTDLIKFKNVFAEAKNQYRRKKFLINNVGVILLGQVADQNPAEWRNMIGVNALGILNGIDSEFKGMIEEKSGPFMNGRLVT